MKKNILFFILLCATLAQTAYSMELASSTSTPKQKRRKSVGRALSDKARSITTRPTLKKRSTSLETNTPDPTAHDQRLPSISEEKTLNSCITINPKDINKINSPHNETLLIWAARNNNSSLIKTLLTYDGILINLKNKYHQTALHYAAEHKNEKIIKKLLLNPQTDASILNDEHKTARDIVKGNSNQDIELRRIIFARIMLDLTVNSVCKTLQDEYAYACHIALIDTDQDQKEIILKALNKINNALKEDQDNQKEEDRDLPEAAKKPTYADDDFIKQMILLRINKGSA